MPRYRRSKASVLQNQRAVAQTPNRPDLINKLNDDCLAAIFKHLPLPERLAVESVCKRWRSAASLAWDNVKEVDLAFDLPLNTGLTGDKLYNYLNEYASRVIKKSGRYLNKLTIGEPCSYQLLPLIAQHCKNLTKLALHFQIYDENSFEVLSQFPKLKYIEIHEITVHIPRNMLRFLPATSMQEIHLFGEPNHGPKCDYAPPPNVSLLALAKFTKLQALTLETLDIEPNIIKLISMNKNLTYLAIANCSIEGKLLPLTGLRNLEHLNLRVAKVCDNFLERLSENCPNLKHLNISDNNIVSDIGIEHLLKLSNLEELLLNAVNDITDVALSRFYTLKKLKCSRCPNISDAGLIMLITYAPNLKYLNVFRTNITNNLLTEANELTRERSNRKILRIVTNYKVKGEWDQKENVSPLLKVYDMADIDIRSKTDPEFMDSDDEHSEDIDEHYDDFAVDPSENVD